MVGYEAEGNCGCRGYPLNTTDFHQRKCSFLSNVFKESDIQRYSFNFFNRSICDKKKTKHVEFIHVDASKIISIYPQTDHKSNVKFNFILFSTEDVKTLVFFCL